MELGATICTPTSPSCSSCPIASHCKALKLVSQNNVTSVTQFPAKVLKAAPREEYVAVCIVELESSQIKSTPASSSLLLVQRPPTGLLAGLWEFPSAPLDNPNSSVELRLTAMDSYLGNILGFDIGTGGYLVKKREEIGTYVHVFSHIRLHMFIELLVLQCCGKCLTITVFDSKIGPYVGEWLALLVSSTTPQMATYLHQLKALVFVWLCRWFYTQVQIGNAKWCHDKMGRCD